MDTENYPFRDEQQIRTFDIEADDSTYVWHRDKEDRKIEVIEGSGWQFQVDGCLPFLLSKGSIFTIEEGVYHRLIKGVDDLKIKIIRLNK